MKLLGCLSLVLCPYLNTLTAKVFWRCQYIFQKHLSCFNTVLYRVAVHSLLSVPVSCSSALVHNSFERLPADRQHQNSVCAQKLTEWRSHCDCSEIQNRVTVAWPSKPPQLTFIVRAVCCICCSILCHPPKWGLRNRVGVTTYCCDTMILAG